MKLKNLYASIGKIILSSFVVMGLVTASLHGQNVKTIIGAGASFPYPLYAKMFETYNKQFGVRVNYQSIGSGGGVRQLKSAIVEFGATDDYLKDKDLAEVVARGQKIIHLPIVLGAVAITYNLRGVRQVRLDGATLADIFYGKIKKWDNPRIKALNPNVKLPNRRIYVVRRSDGSGTTVVFSQFMALSSDEWKQNMGVGQALEWPRGSVGAKGNEGVTGQLKNIPGAIGYVSLNYALQAKLSVAAVKNADGNYVAPSINSVMAAATGTFPEDMRVSLSGRATGGQGYPIATFTWIILYEDQNYNGRTSEQAAALKKLMTWMITTGQQQVSSLHYAPLSTTVRKNTEKLIDKINFDGNEP